MKATKTAFNLLVVPVSVLFVLSVLAVLPLASANSQGWSLKEVTLEEGKSIDINLNLLENNSAKLEIVSWYVPSNTNFLMVSPMKLEKSGGEVTLSFVSIPPQEKETIAPGKYSVVVEATTPDNRKFSLLVYLKLGETSPSDNIENEILTLSDRIKAIETQLENLLDEIAGSGDLAESVAIIDNTVNALENLVGAIESRIELIENQPEVPENLTVLITALDEQVGLIENDIIELSANLQDLKNNPSTNSDDIAALSNAVDTLIQRHAEVSGQVSDLTDIVAANSADVEGTKSGLATVYMIVIVLSIIVIGTALQRIPGIRKAKLLRMLTERQKKHSGPPIVTPSEDAAARAKNKAEAERREREKLGQ